MDVSDFLRHHEREKRRARWKIGNGQQPYGFAEGWRRGQTWDGLNES